MAFLIGHAIVGAAAGFAVGALLVGQLVIVILVFLYVLVLIFFFVLDGIIDTGVTDWLRGPPGYHYQPASEWDGWEFVAPMLVCGCIGAVIGVAGAVLSFLEDEKRFRR